MKDRKGQALVEFVLIIPLLVIILFGIVEIGNIIHKKYLLETHLDTVIDLYKNDKQELIDIYEDENNLDINFKETGSLVTITVSQKVKLITLGIKYIDNPFEIKTKRSFYNNEVNYATFEE